MAKKRPNRRQPDSKRGEVVHTHDKTPNHPKNKGPKPNGPYVGRRRAPRKHK